MILKSIFHRLFFILLILFYSISAFSQDSPKLLKITGRVSDSTSAKNLEFTTVSVKKNGGEVIKTVLTDSRGNFVVLNVPSGKYSVVFLAIGYTPKSIFVDDNAIDSVNLGNVSLVQSVKNLKEVTVSGTRPIIKQEIDRISYDLQVDPDSKINSVLDMMRKVPMLSVDGNDNVQLKGSSNYKILINGKPSSMLDNNPKDLLKSMPASTISKIEVITIPPAKYDAEGLAGIINIITIKQTDNGYTGGVNVNGKFPVGGPGLGGSFAMRQGKFGVSAYYGGSISHTPQTMGINTRQTYGSEPTNLIQNNFSKKDGRTGYFGTEISYELDSLNLLSSQININGNHSENFAEQSSFFNAFNMLPQSYSLLNNNTLIGSGFDASLNYQLGFKKKKSRLLTFSYRFNTYDSDNLYEVDLFNLSNYSLPNYKQTNVAHFTENTTQIDYVENFKRFNIEAGLKGIFRNNKSNFQYLFFDEGSNGFITNPARSNDFNNIQNVVSAYNTYQFSLGSWGFKAGFRIEQTYINADFISTQTDLKQDFFNFIPSLAISKKFKTSSLGFGFTQRIQRPGIYQLNPFVDRSNPNFESSGNPNLVPIVADLLQLNYGINKKAYIGFGLDFAHYQTLINQVVIFDPVTNISRSTYQNTGSAKLFGASFNLNYPITKKWSLSANTKAAYGIIVGTGNGEELRTEGFMYNLGISTGYSFEKGWRINGNYSMNGRTFSLQTVTNGYINSSLSVSKSLLGDKLALSSAVSNPFNKFRNVTTDVSGPNFMQITDNSIYFRGFSMSLNYKFGKLKGDLKKNKRGINNDDISN